MDKTAEEKHTQLYKDILEILQSNFYPLGEKDDDAQCAEMIAKYFESSYHEAKLKEELDAYEKWVSENYGKPEYDSGIGLVNEYLKQRNNGTIS